MNWASQGVPVKRPDTQHVTDAPVKVTNSGTSYDYQQPPMEGQQESSMVHQRCLIDRRFPLFQGSRLTNIVITCLNFHIE